MTVLVLFLKRAHRSNFEKNSNMTLESLHLIVMDTEACYI